MVSKFFSVMLVFLWVTFPYSVGIMMQQILEFYAAGNPFSWIFIGILCFFMVIVSVNVFLAKPYQVRWIRMLLFFLLFAQGVAISLNIPLRMRTFFVQEGAIPLVVYLMIVSITMALCIQENAAKKSQMVDLDWRKIR